MEKQKIKPSAQGKGQRPVYLNPAELAEMLGVRPGTVYSWLSRGVSIPHVKIAGTVRFPERSVVRWLEEREEAQKKRNFEF